MKQEFYDVEILFSNLIILGIEGDHCEMNVDNMSESGEVVYTDKILITEFVIGDMIAGKLAVISATIVMDSLLEIF